MEYSYIDHAGNTGNSVLRTIIVTSFSCNDVTDISTPECEALVALYNSTDGRNRYNSGGWLQPGTVCGTRYGITCSGTQVTEINIQGNNLSGTITSLSGLSYLTYLGLSSNRITSIESGAFNGLSSLIQLALDADQLTSLSNGMFNGLSSLQGLSISSNQITSIESGAFNGVPNLITLSLAGNQISSLGNKVFNSLSSLNSLGLGNNQLTSIKSGTFDGLSSLTTLDLAYNQITFIESGSFSNLSTLLSLGLLVNQLTSLPSGIFDGLSNLTTLSLSVNQLASLGTGSFNGLSSLLFLYLDGNHLTSIASGIFDGLHNLQTLGLENNQIVSVTSGVFSGLSSLVTLGIAPSCSTTFIDLGTGFVCTDTSYTDESTCLAASYCVDQQYTDQISCESHYSCGDQQYTGEAACLAAGYCSDGQYTGQTDCENGGATRNIYGYARSQNTRNNYGNAWISNGVTSQMDTNSCGLISTDDPTELINELNNKGYSNGGGLLGFDENYHIGSFGLSFYDGLTNTISTNIILQYTNQSGYPGEYFNSIAEIQTTNGTNITQNEQPFTGVFHGPVLFTTGNVPELTGVVALMRFGALIHRIDFSQPVIIRMPVLEASVGDTVSIYSSDEESIYGASGAHWQFEKTGTVIDINGIPYVEFTTTHASRYALNNVVHSENNGNNENNGTTDTSHGSPTLTKDVCPTQRDCSSSYYDHLCGPCPTTMTGTKNIHGSATPYCPAYSSELNQAYGFAFDNGITTINSCTTVNLTGTLIRSHMAKMISEFAIRVLKIKPDTTKSCTFTDMKTQSKEMQFYATLACQLGLMGYASDGVTMNINFNPEQEVDRAQFGTILSRLLMGYASDGVTMNINFNPEQEVDRAQFGTILSRLLRGTKYAGGNPYYSKHLTALKADGIMTKIDNPKQKEMRGRVMLMMQRIFEKGKK
ncbi:MAG: leucine-rich repeat domain-containing protein [candidate division SR1 bacterium]|nr:leucine-rich repeat domain-containing protein [candidate division SR1 bacterium]